MRNAFHAEHFTEVTPDDYLRGGPSEEEAEASREEMQDTFPTTLDDE
jgi:hypothetical protein